ncbi:phosphoenolpyruvate hydrolase family protein [Falsiroseomonas sp.]|uniref:phosphoenolpyruvate hydrolase family protein n=1 Tax=Falsiroseomonas sp. TaxID=2870721 RepID=UPI003F70A97E
MPPPHPPSLQPAVQLDALPPAERARRVFLPALAPFPVESWPLVALLPVLDINGSLTAALAARRPFRGAGPIAGVFACDPFLRLADLAATLRAAGITQVVNYPTVQLFEGETAAALAAVNYRAEAEFRLLQRLAELGFAPIACATSRLAVDAALSLGLRRILLHPGIAPRAEEAAWWAGLATRVAVEGGEALAWGAPHQSSSPRRRMRL